MNVQAEVRLYPLRTGKLAGPVADFCDVLRSRGLRVEGRSMSTFITGESKDVFEALGEGFETVAQRSAVVVDFTISNACPETVRREPERTERMD